MGSRPSSRRAGEVARWACRCVPDGQAEFGLGSLRPGSPRSGRASYLPAASRAVDTRHAGKSWGGGLRKATRTQGAVHGVGRKTDPRDDLPGWHPGAETQST